MERTIEEVEKVQNAIDRGARLISIDGLTSVSAKSHVLSQINAQKPIVVVTDSNSSLETWECDLRFWNKDPDSSIVSLPSFETDVYSGSSPHAETMERRALTLWRLSHSMPTVLLMSARSLATRTVLPGEILSLGSSLKLGDEVPLGDLTIRLSSAGYVRERSEERRVGK